MRKYRISTGKDYINPGVQVKEVSSDAIVKRLKQFHVSDVKRADYIALAPKAKAALKKHPGFFIGGDGGGAKTRGSWRGSGLAVLDLDDLTPDRAEASVNAIKTLKAHAVIYGTASHTPEKPRLRAVIFLDQDVDPDDYRHLIERLAARLPAGAVSSESLKPTQIMYFPQRCSDGEEFFLELAGQPLEVAPFLAEQRTEAGPERPRKVTPAWDKPGIVGAVARRYEDDLDAAIDELGIENVPYEASSFGPTCAIGERRYTRVGASGADGALWYPNDGHLFSHHGQSDPGAQKSQTIFDIVRLTRFQKLDAGLASDHPIQLLPSHKAATAWFVEKFPEMGSISAGGEFGDLGTADDASAIIRYEPRCEVFQLDSTLQALNQYGADLGLYTFAGSIVEPSHDSHAKSFDGRDVSVFELVALNHEAFAARMGKRIVFGMDVKGKFKVTPCPRDLSRAVFNQTRKLGAIEIRKITQTPIWRDGALHAIPGFDKTTHTWIESPQVDLPTVSDKVAAVRARDYLLTWLAEFPFATPIDRAVAVAALVSAAMRASVRPPAFVITKPSHGAGASTLTDLFHVALTGSSAPVINGANPKEEIDKEVNAAQRAGRAALVFDNIPAGYGFNSTAAAQAISQETRTIRPLGLTDSITVECSQLVILNGKNMRVADDLVRRCLVIELDPKMESPETRTFRRPGLIKDALRDRAHILKAAFTIVAAYAASGEQVVTRSLAGFDDWCRTVGAALMWIGEPDLTASQQKLKEDDPTRQSLESLFRVCRVLFSENQSFTAAQVMGEGSSNIYDESGTDEEKCVRSAARDELEQLLEDIAVDPRGRVNPKSLGFFFRKHKGAVIDGYQLQATMGHKSTVRWKFKRIGEFDDELASPRSDTNTAAALSENGPEEPIDTAWLDDAPQTATGAPEICVELFADVEAAIELGAADEQAIDTLRMEEPAADEADYEVPAVFVNSSTAQECCVQTFREDLDLDNDEAAWLVEQGFGTFAEVALADCSPLIDRFGERRAGYIQRRAHACEPCAA